MIVRCHFCSHIMADYTIILLIKGGNLSGTNSYQSLVQSTFGLPGFFILSALQFLYPFIGTFSTVFFLHHSHLFCFLYIVNIRPIAFFWVSVLPLLMSVLSFAPKLWLVTISQQETHWVKSFKEYQEVWCVQILPDKPKKSTFLKGFVTNLHICHCILAVGPGHFLAERHFVIVVVTLVFTLPLSLYRNIERLGKVTHRRVFFSREMEISMLPVCVTRFPSCQWCWLWPFSSSSPSEQLLWDLRCIIPLL